MTPASGTPAEQAASPQQITETLTARPDIPGAQVAGITASGTSLGAAGTADTETGVPVTAATRFRPGSVTKLITATLIMQLAEQGLLSLDDRAHRYVPELRLADQEMTAAITIRDLLSHASGIDAGDLFTDTGDSGTCRQDYIRALDGCPFLFPPGTSYSYNNAGFVIAGLIIERLRGLPYEDAAWRYLFEPLGMTGTGFLAGRQAAAQTAGYARGHRAATSPVTPLPWGTGNPMCSRALAPAGGTLTSTARDLAVLAASHLAIPGTARAVTPDTARLMRQVQVPAPGAPSGLRGTALAWNALHDGRARISGSNPGQRARIIADPASPAALVILTNSTVQGGDLLTGHQAAGSPGQQPARPAARDLTCYAGEYASHAARLQVRPHDGHLLIRGGRSGTDHPLQPAGGDTFTSAGGSVWFTDFDQHGTPQFLRWRLRAFRRTHASATQPPGDR